MFNINMKYLMSNPQGEVAWEKDGPISFNTTQDNISYFLQNKGYLKYWCKGKFTELPIIYFYI